MKIIRYGNHGDIDVQFLDEHGYIVRHTTYSNFKVGTMKNPYDKTIYGVGFVGIKYLTHIDCKNTREYETWVHILQRSFDDKLKQKQTAYLNVTCCEEWLSYENFYEWIHSQENFDKWLNESRWAIDKDIIVKGNKIYSPNTCTLVPQIVNCLFLNKRAKRGEYPLGVKVKKDCKGFYASCSDPLLKKNIELGSYPTKEEAFMAYKEYKEGLIKRVAELEFSQGNITERCYNAMINYQVEIDD